MKTSSRQYREWFQLLAYGRSKVDAPVGCWKVFKWALLEDTNRTCAWPKGGARYRETWRWNDDVNNSVRRENLKSSGNRETSIRKKYLEAKRNTPKAVY